ncbi:MAG: hypothetical protein U5O39_07710 [Gammaproteobacteria bacterium]|nr:hypothetical protein [Gammaproteobacteria bacterium]
MRRCLVGLALACGLADIAASAGDPLAGLLQRATGLLATLLLAGAALLAAVAGLSGGLLAWPGQGGRNTRFALRRR